MPRLRAAERKRKIIQAAIERFSTHGFGGTTTRELARQAGISEALLFRHFPNKRKLYEAILSAKMEEQVPFLLQNLNQNGDPKKVLMVLARRIVLQNEKDPSLLRLLLYSALEGHELSDLFFQRRTLPLLEFLKSFLKQQERSGRLRVPDPETAARAFLGMVFSYVQTRLLFRVPQVMKRSPDGVLKSYVEIFVRGLTR